MNTAINNMVTEIVSIIDDCKPSIYLYGSVVLDDFRLGWSDIDILVLTEKSISEPQAKKLVGLRQAMLAKEPLSPYYRSFEGGMFTLDAFVSGKKDTVVYWGTSGERITDTYHFDSFSMTELIERGKLLYGADVRNALTLPTFHMLYADVRRHYEAIRKYVQKADRSLYSFGWMLDIARCLYTLRTGKIITKTEAAVWALENELCPTPDVLRYALQVRREPLTHKENAQTLDYAETLAEPIGRFADVLEEELKNTSGSALSFRRDVGDVLTVICNEKPIGKIELYNHCFHSQNQYLRLDLLEYKNVWATPLFSHIQKTVKKSLQVMVSSNDTEQVDFLLAGGFLCKRKCYEMDVNAKDLVLTSGIVPINAAKKGASEYDVCCRLLFDYYKHTHAAINPLTADVTEFCEGLPEKVLYQSNARQIIHFAFIEGNEIAYIGSTDVSSIQPFAESVVQILFSDYETICFECDDCDAAAIALKGLFHTEIHESFDTYVLA